MSIPARVSSPLAGRAPGLLLVLLVLGAPEARAQIVNVQGLFDEKTQGTSWGAELSADWRTGNTELMSVRVGLMGQWRVAPHTWLAVVRGEYALARGERIVSRLMEHVRHRYQLTEWLSSEAFVQHEYDEFRRLQLRALVGAGPRFTLWDAEAAGLVLGAAGMLEHERLRPGEEPDAGTRATDVRLSSYVLGRVRLMQNVDLTETLYVQPRVTRFADVRVLNETALAVTPNEHLVLSVGLLLMYDAVPPSGVAGLDTQLRTTLGFKL